MFCNFSDFWSIFIVLNWSHFQSKMAFIFSISLILVLSFPFFMIFFPKCEGKGSFLKIPNKITDLSALGCPTNLAWTSSYDFNKGSTYQTSD